MLCDRAISIHEFAGSDISLILPVNSRPFRISRLAHHVFETSTTMICRCLPSTAVMLLAATVARADVTPASPFTDHMVLQQGDATPAVSYTHLTLPTIYSV